jgi:hypothetical protein
MRGLSPIYMYVSDTFPRAVHIFSGNKIGRPVVGIYKPLTDTVEIGTEAAQFWENLFRIFSSVSLQCKCLSCVVPDVECEEGDILAQEVPLHPLQPAHNLLRDLVLLLI